MSKRKSRGSTAGRSRLGEVVCILNLNTAVDNVEVEIHCQRANGVDRVFSPSMTWPQAERPSESTLAASVAVLMRDIIMGCLSFVGDPSVIRGGLLSKKRVETIIHGVRLEMSKIKNENEASRNAEIVTKAADWRLSPEASGTPGTWIARCPGTNHTLELQPKRNLFYCGYCKVGGGIPELEEFAARRTTAK